MVVRPAGPTDRGPTLVRQDADSLALEVQPVAGHDDRVEIGGHAGDEGIAE